MKKGKLECTGTIAKLKEDHSQGFTVKLKLKIPTLTVAVNSTNEDSTSVASQSQPLNSSVTDELRIPTDLTKNIDENSKNINELKVYFNKTFDAKLIDQHSVSKIKFKMTKKLFLFISGFITLPLKK